MKLSLLGALVALFSHHAFAASDEPEEKPRNPCTIRSPTTGSYFDLTSLNVTLPGKEDIDKDVEPPKSWHARGYDYKANFTINICGAVVEKLGEVEGISTAEKYNTSAFYEKGGKTYSIGQMNDELVMRGRKLVLNYTDGSPCPAKRRRRSALPEGFEDVWPEKRKDDETRRKTSVMSLLCERDPLANKVSASFVGQVDDCTYFFEIRTSAACPSIEVAKQQIGPGGVFGVIALIAILVYVAGGCMYQRAVQNQRGWRQLPNYALWAGIGTFFRDLLIILTSSCFRWLPRTRGYGVVSSHRRGHSDDENRLIDQLDEEWED